MLVTGGGRAAPGAGSAIASYALHGTDRVASVIYRLVRVREVVSSKPARAIKPKTYKHK